jgi:hypothetical protein
VTTRGGTPSITSVIASWSPTATGSSRDLSATTALPLATWLAGRGEGRSPAEEAAGCEAPGPLEELSRIAEGLVPIHHVLRADRIARKPEAAFEEQLLIEEVRASFGRQTSAGACQMTDRLCAIPSAMTA